jgi:uncharacterized protein (TIGR03083 family)
MDAHRLLARLRAEAAHIAAFAADRDLGAAVPPCPDWDVREVIRHLGSVQRRVTGWVRDQSPPQVWEREPPDGDVIAWFREGAAELYDELSARQPGEPCATWWPHDRTAGFWWRRMAHEAAVHRVDVESAYGPVGPIEDEFALDGVDEVLSVMLRRPPNEHCAKPYIGGSGQVLGVAAGSGLWRVELGAESPEVSRQLPDDADAVLIGDPRDVYLWLWGRGGDQALQVKGDREAAATFRIVLAAALQ